MMFVYSKATRSICQRIQRLLMTQLVAVVLLVGKDSQNMFRITVKLN